MLIVAVLTEAPLKFEAEASVDGDVGAVLPPSELPCLNRFGSLELDEQLSCLQQAKRAAIADVSANSQLARLLENCDGNIDHRVIAGLLDVVRNQGQNAHELAEIVSRFLPHQADIYQGRDKWHVLRLRAYTFVTLSEIGFPDSALPMLVDALAYVDERMSAVEFGAATRVVGTLNSQANATFRLEFFANAAADPSGYGEGQRYLGSAVVSTDAGGNVSFDVTLSGASSLGEIVTATATDPNGNTSEFSGVHTITVLSVQIDIKPGNFPNSINLGSSGTVPVAIFSTATFDATTVNPTTVTLAGATVKLKGNGTSMASNQDVNGDGRLDLGLAKK
mgnify:CR=1 FL=1